MTRSDKIIEFLKYASPRLDYIEHCMEKQALSPQKVLPVIKAFRARASKGTIDPSRYKRIGALSHATGKLKGNEKNQLNRVGGQLHKKYYGGNYTKGDYSKVKAKAKGSVSPEAAYLERYGYMPDMDMVNASTATPKRVPTQREVEGILGLPQTPRQGTGELLLRNNGFDPRQAANTAMQNLIPESTINNTLGAFGFPRPGTGEMLLRNAGKDAAKASEDFAKVVELQDPTTADKIKSWITNHPYLALGGGVAAGAAGGAGIGYGVGSGSGIQEGSQIAQRYYAMREALQQQALRKTNDSFFARLGNLFGTGDLSNIIG